MKGLKILSCILILDSPTLYSVHNCVLSHKHVKTLLCIPLRLSDIGSHLAS